MTILKQNTVLTVQGNNTGLTPFERDVIKQLPFSLQAYVKAMDSPKVFEMKPGDAETMIYDLITETQLNIGHTKSAEDMEINLVSSAAILNLIYQKYRSLTVAELKLSFLNGSIGDYGEYIGVNLLSASKWIKGYSLSEIKKRAFEEWNKKIDAREKVELTDEEKNKMNLQACISYYNDFRSGSVQNYVTDLLRAIYYDILLSNGLINFDEGKRYEIHEMALDEIKRNPNKKQKGLGSEISLLAKQQGRLNEVSKRIALHEYFRDLIKDGKELSELLKLKNE